MSTDEREVRWCVEERNPAITFAVGWEFVIGYANEGRARDAFEAHRDEVVPLGWHVQLVKVTTVREVQAEVSAG